jgi:hypothetical protein
MTSTDELPREIEVQQLPGNGIRYVFPRRQFTSVGMIGTIMIFVGLAGLVFIAYWASEFVGGLQRLLGPAGFLSVLVTIPFVIGAASSIGIGLAFLFGHAEIEAIDGKVRSIERVGRFHWTRSRKAADIRRLVVDSKSSENDAQPPARANAIASVEAFQLKAELANGKIVWLLIGYPRDWLLPLARRLAVQCDASRNDPGEPATMIDVVDIAPGEPGEDDRWEQPADSEIVFEPLPGGLTLNVPAPGIRRGSAGLFTFGLVWCGALAIITGVVALSSFQGQNQDGWFGFAAFLAMFWTVGIGVLLMAISMGRRSAGFAIVDGKLMILQISPFGSKSNEWRLEELQSVRIGPSGMEVNNVPVMELQIVPLEGRPFGMLRGRDVGEIEWVATLLRAAVRSAKTGPDETDEKSH